MYAKFVGIDVDEEGPVSLDQGESVVHDSTTTAVEECAEVRIDQHSSDGADRWLKLEAMSSMDEVLDYIERQAFKDNAAETELVIRWARKGLAEQRLSRRPHCDVIEACGRHRGWGEKADLCSEFGAWVKSALENPQGDAQFVQ